MFGQWKQICLIKYETRKDLFSTLFNTKYNQPVQQHYVHCGKQTVIIQNGRNTYSNIFQILTWSCFH